MKRFAQYITEDVRVNAITKRLLAALDDLAVSGHIILEDWVRLKRLLDSGKLAGIKHIGTDQYPFGYPLDRLLPAIDRWVRNFKQELQRLTEDKQAVVAEAIGPNVTTKRLREALDDFVVALQIIFEEWSKLNVLDNAGKLGGKRRLGMILYPFEYPLDRLLPGVDRWVRSFKQELQTHITESAVLKDDVDGHAENAVIKLQAHLKIILGPRYVIRAAFSKNLGKSIHLRVADTHPVNGIAQNSPVFMQIMMFLSSSFGKNTDLERVSWEMSSGPRSVPYRKIGSTQSIDDATNKLIDWFKKSKPELDALLK